MCDIDSKYTKIEETFRGKELELSEFYRDLESKLHVEQNLNDGTVEAEIERESEEIL